MCVRMVVTVSDSHKLETIHGKLFSMVERSRNLSKVYTRMLLPYLTSNKRV